MRIPDDDVIISLEECLDDLKAIGNDPKVGAPAFAAAGRIDRRLRAIVHTLSLPDLPAR
jgi:hypothetical protein